MSVVEITGIKDLQKNKSYFSRFYNKNFTFISKDDTKGEIKIGVNGKLETVSYRKFFTCYLKGGVIEN